MSHYLPTKVYLSEKQIEKLKAAARNGESITLQIDANKPPNFDMYLTKTQLGQLSKGKRITISKSQLKKNGGFLPFLAPILATIATGALSGAAGWGTKKILDKTTGGSIVSQLIQHPLFLDALHGLVRRYILPPQKGGGAKKKCGKGVLQNWEYPTKS